MRDLEIFDMATAINNEVVPSIWVTSRCEGVLNLTLQELLVGTLFSMSETVRNMLQKASIQARNAGY